MQVGFFQYDVVHDFHQNIQLLESYLKQNVCDLIVLPELSLCGYLFNSQKELYACAQYVPNGSATQHMLALSKQYACTLLFGIAEKELNQVFNTAVMVSKGKYIGKYRKIHLSDFEKKYFSRGNENTVFIVDGIKIGVQICFDLWFPEISREQIQMGANLLCALANFGGETTYHITKIRAIENLTPLILCNRIGLETIPGMDAEFLGKSTIIDATGKRLCIAPEGKEAFEQCDVLISQIRGNVICRDFDQEMNIHYHLSDPISKLQ